MSEVAFQLKHSSLWVLFFEVPETCKKGGLFLVLVHGNAFHIMLPKIHGWLKYVATVGTFRMCVLCITT